MRHLSLALPLRMNSGTPLSWPKAGGRPASSVGSTSVPLPPSEPSCSPQGGDNINTCSKDRRSQWGLPLRGWLSPSWDNSSCFCFVSGLGSWASLSSWVAIWTPPSPRPGWTVSPKGGPFRHSRRGAFATDKADGTNSYVPHFAGLPGNDNWLVT